MKNLASFYKDNNIRVNAVNPGVFRTSALENALLKWPNRDPVDLEGADLFVSKGASTFGEGLISDSEDI